MASAKRRCSRTWWPSAWRRRSGRAWKSRFRTVELQGVAAVGEGMREERWSYPPDYVSAETLAYRLDCSRSTIDAYVRLGLLPKPESIGNLQRWDFGQVKAFIKAQNAATHELQGSALGEEDAYLKGLKGWSPKKG